VGPKPEFPIAKGKRDNQLRFSFACRL
jgi:hypothetical protein